MSTVWLLTRDAIDDNEGPRVGGVLGSLMHPPVWATGLSVGAFALNTCLADCIVVSFSHL